MRPVSVGERCRDPGPRTTKSWISVGQLADDLFGHAYLERQKRVLNIVQDEYVFPKTNQASLSRPDRYALGLARGKRMRQLMDIHKWSEDDLLIAEYLIDDVQPFISISRYLLEP